MAYERMPAGNPDHLGTIPPEFLVPSRYPGTVIAEEYPSRDYASPDCPSLKKVAYVHVPYGYGIDPARRYNVLYLMHGWTMTAEGFFYQADSRLPYLLDAMGAAGLMAPTIVVSATFDAQNQPQDFARSFEELSLFYLDFREHLMPFIEGKYRTFAQGTSGADLAASRAHRAFGGFDMGAVCTWDQMVRNLEYVSRFVPMAGDCWKIEVYGGLHKPVETAELLAGAVEGGRWGEEDFLVYAGQGTADPLWDPLNTQMGAMGYNAAFTKRNLHYAVVQDGFHELATCERILYHALPLLFPKA